MKIAITGASGFIGKHLLDRCQKSEFQINVLQRNPTIDQKAYSNVSYFQGDLLENQCTLREFTKDVDVLFHCAAQLNPNDKLYNTNVIGTHRLICKSFGNIKHWIQISSAGVFGARNNGVVTESSSHKPVGLYENTKNIADSLVKYASLKGGFNHTIIYPTIVFGEDMPNNSLRALINSIKKRQFFFIGNPNRSKVNYIYIENLIDAILVCASNEKAHNEDFIVNDFMTVKNFIKTITDNLKIPEIKLQIPLPVVSHGVRLLSPIKGFPLTMSRVEALTNEATYSINKLCSHLNYKNRISIEKGLSQLINQMAIIK
jgi:nucleoside-diphosphate-sugar epimerase